MIEDFARTHRSELIKIEASLFEIREQRAELAARAAEQEKRLWQVRAILSTLDAVKPHMAPAAPTPPAASAETLPSGAAEEEAPNG